MKRIIIKTELSCCLMMSVYPIRVYPMHLKYTRTGYLSSRNFHLYDFHLYDFNRPNPARNVKTLQILKIFIVKCLIFP